MSLDTSGVFVYSTQIIDEEMSMCGENLFHTCMYTHKQYRIRIQHTHSHIVNCIRAVNEAYAFGCETYPLVNQTQCNIRAAPTYSSA